MQQLKNQKDAEGKSQWDKHPRFMIKTTSSAISWDEWAEKNGVAVVNTPVGFKELANIMKKVEKQMVDEPKQPVIVEDVYGKEINLGINPRLVFAGEESGGMIIGPEKLIKSDAGREAIALREKNAAEGIIITSALISQLEKSGTMLSDHLSKIFKDNHIKYKYDIREDITYYDENETDQTKRGKAIAKGEIARTDNDIFYLDLALAVRRKDLGIKDAIKILNSTFEDKGLKFDDLKDIKFVGDGTYFEFKDKCIEIRPSGTDAKTKAYGAGIDKKECIKFAKAMGNYSGRRNDVYRKYLPEPAKSEATEIYNKWSAKGAPQNAYKPQNKK